MPHPVLQSTGIKRKIGQDTPGSLTGDTHEVRNPVDRANLTFGKADVGAIAENSPFVPQTNVTADKILRYAQMAAS